MPFIHVKTNVAVPEDKERAMKTKLGKAIEILPGKSEQWLMLDFSDRQRMYFQGDNSQPIAMVEVKIYGNDYEKCFLRKMCLIVSFFA